MKSKYLEIKYLNINQNKEKLDEFLFDYFPKVYVYKGSLCVPSGSFWVEDKSIGSVWFSEIYNMITIHTNKFNLEIIRKIFDEFSRLHKIKVLIEVK